MKSTFLLFIISLFLFSCSHQPSRGVSIVAPTSGLMKNSLAPFSVYLTDTLVNRTDLEKKYSGPLYIVHTGHILSPKLSKDENEKNLNSLITLGINLVNLTLEDFIIAELQGIKFENYNQKFLNSSVIDVNLDGLVKAKNINSYETSEGMAFLGLSDKRLDKKLIKEETKEKYIINDYVLSILKVKKTALQNSPVNSFVIIHTLGNEINEVMTRLPPSYINSLAN
jgi:hypothetical protein